MANKIIPPETLLIVKQIYRQKYESHSVLRLFYVNVTCKFDLKCGSHGFMSHVRSFEVIFWVYV